MSFDALLIVGFGGPEKPEDVMPFLENVTSGPVAAMVGLTEVPGASGRGLVVPNSSVFTCSGATPSSVRMAFVASIISGGPQRWILREARSGTVRVRSSEVIRPRGPFQSVPSALSMTTATRSLGLARSSAATSVAKMNSAGGRHA